MEHVMDEESETTCQVKSRDRLFSLVNEKGDEFWSQQVQARNVKVIMRDLMRKAVEERHDGLEFIDQLNTDLCKQAIGRSPESMMDAIMVNETETTCKARSLTRFKFLITPEDSEDDKFWSQKGQEEIVKQKLSDRMKQAVDERHETVGPDFIEMHANRECTREIRKMNDVLREIRKLNDDLKFTDFTLQECTDGSKERYEELVADYWSNSDYADWTREEMRKAMAVHKVLQCEDDAGAGGKLCTPLRETMKSEMRGFMNDAISQWSNRAMVSSLWSQAAEHCLDNYAISNKAARDECIYYIYNEMLCGISAVIDENSISEFPEMEECLESVGSLAATLYP